MITFREVLHYQARLDASPPGLSDIEAQRPAVTVGLLQLLIEDADQEYSDARQDCETAALRCRMLREALRAWGIEAPPLRPGAKITANNQQDVLFREYRRLEKQGIRLPLFPNSVVMPPACPPNRERRARGD